MEALYWVGIKESEISLCSDLFAGSVTYSGSGKNGNISYVNDKGEILNYNNDSEKLDTFIKTTLLILIKKNPNIRFMFYNAYYAYFLGEEIIAHTICLNEKYILDLLRDKMKTRFWLSNDIPVLKTVAMTGAECTIEYLEKLFSGCNSFVVQGCTGAGGNDTYVVNRRTFSEIQKQLSRHEIYIASPYLERAFSVNVHVLIKENFEITPGSVQIVQEEDHRLVYHGGDFIEYQNISKDIKETVNMLSEKISTHIKNIGYKGVLGIDYIICGEKVYFLEINPRFQSSTALINQTLSKTRHTSVQEIVYQIFENSGFLIPEIKENIMFSNYIVDDYPHYGHYDTYIKNAQNSLSVEKVLLDGYRPQAASEHRSSLFSVLFHTNIVTINPNGRLNIHENVQAYARNIPYLHTKLDFFDLKTKLMTQGVRLTEKTQKHYAKNGLRKGTYSSLDIYFNSSMIVNCPVDLKLCDMSPFAIDFIDNNIVLTYADELVTPIYMDTDEAYLALDTKSGSHFKHLSFLATDRLRMHHSIGCYFRNISQGCLFCDVPPISLPCDIEDVKEVMHWHLENSKFEHILIGGGSQKREVEYKKILEIIRYIRTQSDKKIYLMSLPPVNEDILEEYYHAGLSEIALNIEIYDREVAGKYMPGKAKIHLDEYKKMLLKAVSLWGNKGNVKSLLIYGLEKDESFLDGIEWLASHGIQPVISVFRPLADTELSDRIPSSSADLYHIFERIIRICRNYCILPGPNCVYCQNNTLSVWFDNFPSSHN